MKRWSLPDCCSKRWRWWPSRMYIWRDELWFIFSGRAEGQAVAFSCLVCEHQRIHWISIIGTCAHPDDGQLRFYGHLLLTRDNGWYVVHLRSIRFRLIGGRGGGLGIIGQAAVGIRIGTVSRFMVLGDGQVGVNKDEGRNRIYEQVGWGIPVEQVIDHRVLWVTQFYQFLFSLEP